jgi:5-oxoprolinase (ATP-hydrolysing) subunit A
MERMAKTTIDLNADMGETVEAWMTGRDAALMDYVSSVNIACGFHAGDAHTMQGVAQQALAKQCAIGAHPGLPDREGFGRRVMAVTPAEVYAMVYEQVMLLQEIVQALGGRLHHVKPHGALYNMAAADKQLAAAIASAVKAAGEDLWLYGLSGSHLISEARKAKLPTASEVFADRSYQSDGSLTPRSQPGALIATDAESLAQVMHFVEKGMVLAQTGEWVSVQADTVCIHGDGEHALLFAQKIHLALTENNMAIVAPSIYTA